MALEDKIDKLIVALEADTAARKESTAARKESTALLLKLREEELTRRGEKATGWIATVQTTEDNPHGDTPKRGRGRPRNSETAASETTADAETVEETKSAEPEKPTYTIEQVKAAGIALKDQQGVAAAKAMVAKHGAEAVAKMPEASFAAFVADCEASIAKFAADNADDI